MDKEQAIQKILNFLKDTEKLIPNNLLDDLDPIEGYPDIPAWHKFEDDIWKIGENIRQIFKEHKTLRKDKDLLEKIVSICLNRNAKRGRQSFIMLLANKGCTPYADKLISNLDDKFVDGQIIAALNKTKVSGHVAVVRPFCSNKTTWIRNEAKKYVAQYDK